MATADVLPHRPEAQQLLEQEYDTTVRQDIELFRSQAQDFLAGKLTVDEFRPFRLRRGIYGQRQDGVQMIRTKVPGGMLTVFNEGLSPEEHDETRFVRIRISDFCLGGRYSSIDESGWSAGGSLVTFVGALRSREPAGQG